MYDIRKLTIFYEDKVDFYGKPYEDSLHSLYLRDYCVNNNVSLDGVISRDSANSLVASLVDYKNVIVTMNGVAGYDDWAKYKGFCTVVVPLCISSSLYDNICNYQDFFNLFDDVIVTEAYRDIDGDIGTRMITVKGDNNFDTILKSIEKNVVRRVK